MAKGVTDLAREVMARMDRGEPIEEAISMALATSELQEATRSQLEAAGLREAVVHEAFHELLEWHAGFGGMVEFAEIDDAIHRMAERVGHDLEEGPESADPDVGRRPIH
jgi:hypothetical protein